MEQTVCQNERVRQIRHGLHLTQSLYVSSILIGPPATGKRSLVRGIFPTLPEIDGGDAHALAKALEVENALIIHSFEKVRQAEELDFQNKRIVAIADAEIDKSLVDEKFAFIYRMPPLKERPEDVAAFTQLFLSEAKAIFTPQETIRLEPSDLDLSENLRSLRASIYREVMLQSMNAQEIEKALYYFFSRTLEGNNAYREHLGILERPMLQAGLKRYGSQLKLSEILGINRNTLRKKLHEYRID